MGSGPLTDSLCQSLALFPGSPCPASRRAGAGFCRGLAGPVCGDRSLGIRFRKEPWSGAGVAPLGPPPRGDVIQTGPAETFFLGDGCRRAASKFARSLFPCWVCEGTGWFSFSCRGVRNGRAVPASSSSFHRGILFVACETLIPKCVCVEGEGGLRVTVLFLFELTTN